MKVPVYILAGGRSRRFGSDKARARFDGVPQIVRLSKLTGGIARTVTVVASAAGAYQDLGLRTIGDLRSGLGPLGGLYTALDDAGDGWILLLACDWVGVEATWLGTLLNSVSEKTSVICFENVGYEPLLSLYHSSIRDVVLRQIERGELAMHQLLRRVDVTALPVPSGWERAENLNIPR